MKSLTILNRSHTRSRVEIEPHDQWTLDGDEGADVEKRRRRMNNANSLKLRRVNENLQLTGLFDGAMSAALTRGQLPPRQRRLHHRHQHRNHHRRPHQRHFHRLKVNHNNQHSHNHSLSLQHANHFQGQCRLTSHQQNCRKDHRDKLENDKECRNEVDESENLVEKRPKVNPIFLWALQKEQRIIEVRCEDYDKRNRIKLTKTPHGWRSIPRTSSNVYSSCSCPGLNRIPITKDELATSSPSVSSTSIPRSILVTSQNASLSGSSLPESMPLSLRPEPYNRRERKSRNNRMGKSQSQKRVVKKSKQQMRSPRYLASGNEKCNATRSLYRTSQKSFGSSYIDDEDDEESPDDVDFEEDNRFEQYKSKDNKNGVASEKGEIKKATKNAVNSRFVDCESETIKYIDLEEARKNQLLQPRVILEPLNTFTIRLNTSRERRKLDDEIEMIVVEGNAEDDNENVHEEMRDDVTTGQLNNVERRINCLAEDNKSFQHNCSKTEDSEYEIEDIEEIDDKDIIEGLDEENPTVFEYDDRDSVDMMDDNELEEHDEILKPTKIYSSIDDKFNEDVHQMRAITDKDDIIEVKGVPETKNLKIGFKQIQLIGNSSQVPDLKPIQNDLWTKIANDSVTRNQKVNYSCTRRLLPSPPCSVTCSEDASQFSSQNSDISSIRRRREAPDLIEVHPTVWRKCGELVRPAHQLRKLIEKSGHSIPDPLLVPRNCLPALAANPGVEIPRLLVTRPELRLPEAVMRPDLLADPDILVISLSHLQQVLDAIPDPVKFYIQENVDEYGISNNGTISSYMNSNRKRLSVKPIGSLMPAPIDLSQHSAPEPEMGNSIFHKRCKCSRQESEVTSTARLPGDDSRLWHPLFGCREKSSMRDGVSRTNVNSQSTHDRSHEQCLSNYQQTHQDTNHQHRPSWHRTTLAS